jgi:hypothetical protein
VYYDPSIIQAVDLFQLPAEHSAVSLQNDDVEAVDHVVEDIEQDVDVEEQEVEDIDHDVQVPKEEEVEAIDRDGMNE